MSKEVKGPQIIGTVECEDGPVQIKSSKTLIVDMHEVFEMCDRGEPSDKIQETLGRLLKEAMGGREVECWVVNEDGSRISSTEWLRKRAEKKREKFRHISIDELRRNKSRKKTK